MPQVTGVTLLHISFCLLLFECLPSAIRGELRCYSCKSMAGLPHSRHCMETSEMTYTEECPSTAKYCKKRVARQENYTVIERTCEEKCLEQTNVQMMSGVVLDTYCCQTDLCNSATSWLDLRPLIQVLICGFMSWMCIRNVY